MTYSKGLKKSTGTKNSKSSKTGEIKAFLDKQKRNLSLEMQKGDLQVEMKRCYTVN
jgi:hypothetical protein